MAEKKSKKTTTAGAKQASTAKKPPAAKSDAPRIDTSLAAQAAAKMVASGSATHAPSAQPPSAAFKKLKEGLNKPSSQGVASFLNSTAPAKKTNVPFGGPNQVRRNQTFGADVNRTGVPRRTGG